MNAREIELPGKERERERRRVSEGKGERQRGLKRGGAVGERQDGNGGSNKGQLACF